MPYAAGPGHCRHFARTFIFTLTAYSQHLALWAIRAYQRYLSPYKGFSCAYRVLTGRDSCSGYGYRVIARHGLIPGWALLRRRLHACGKRHREHLAQHRPALRTARHRAQAGHCDAPAAACDFCGGCTSNLGDFADILNCGSGNISWFAPRNGYTTSKEMRRQQVEYRKKIKREHGSKS